MTLADQLERDRIESDLDTTFVVEAAAGTGKTTALVGRIISLIRSGKGQLSRIVAVTFTEKAAGEMKLRLRGAIEKARAAATEQQAVHLHQALAELEEARIGTIHSLCADLLKERPVEARIDPMFEVAAEDQSARLFDQAFEAWFQRTLADPPEGVRRVLRRAPGWDGTGPREQLREAGWSLKEHRDFRAPWVRVPFDREGAIDAFLVDLFELADLSLVADEPDAWLVKQLALVHLWVQELRNRESVAARDHDAIEAELRELRGARFKWDRWNFHPRRPFSRSLGLEPSDVKARRDALKVRLDAVVAACEADLAPALHDELWPLVDAYQDLKQRAGCLDFIDLLQDTRDLLVTDADVRAELQQRFTHLLVDEFQDNDPLQTEIVLLLAADDPAQSDAHAVQVVPGKLFLVGDPKQSIYRFRRADVKVYHSIKARLLQQDAQVLHLSTSFRSDPRIQQAVNAALAPCMQGGSQAEYVPLQPFRQQNAGQPAVVALPVPEPYGEWGTQTHFAVERSLPEAVGAWVHWLLTESGWLVTEPGQDEPVPVQARHVCLLFRRFNSFGRSVPQPYVRALEARQIAHVLVGGRSFHDREEILAVRNALNAIEWPDDELSVFATLRGPLFAVGDDALVAWREQIGSLDPLRPIEPESELIAEVAAPLAILAELHRKRNRRPIADTITRLLEATRAQAGLALWTGGEQVLANVLRVPHQARVFEAHGATSFRSFVDHLAAEAGRGETGEAPVVEEGTDGVRVMTVHKAKGLEFPVVVLCDPTCKHHSDRPSRYVDATTGLWAEPIAGCIPSELQAHADVVQQEDAEESDRLLYVAATRARDVLVVPATADEELTGGWLQPLHRALYPPDHQRTQAWPAPGCPPFGDDPVTKRNGAKFSGDPVRPGLHAPADGPHKVVWWDSSRLALRAQGPSGMRSMDLLVEDDHGTSARQAAAHTQWVQARTDCIVAGARPSRAVATPTELGEEALGEPTPLDIEDTGVPRKDRPHGKRFGTLVHAVLAEVELTADLFAIERTASLHARLVGAPPDEVRAAVQAVHAALSHPLLRRAAASKDCRREVPITLHSDGHLVEGIVDLAFKEQQGWMVVDFKTDLDLTALLGAYEVQVGWYTRAIQAATGLPARGVLLRV